MNFSVDDSSDRSGPVIQVRNTGLEVYVIDAALGTGSARGDGGGSRNCIVIVTSTP
jgi:hypothetical protein